LVQRGWVLNNYGECLDSRKEGEIKSGGDMGKHEEPKEANNGSAIREEQKKKIVGKTRREGQY